MRGLVGALLATAVAVPGAAAQTPGADMPMMQPDIFTYVAFDELEWLATGDESAIEYDGDLWIGGDVHRIWFKAAGEQSAEASDGYVDVQALYSRAISSFWNVQVGPRLEALYGDGSATRAHLGAGVQGLAPYWFEVEAFAFLSQDGDLSARAEVSYDLLLSQRMMLESEVETAVSASAAEEWGLDSGFNEIELGARMRYEIVREVAPYVGWSWTRLLSGTAALARAAGRNVGHGALVLGVHFWW
jgi:copper resistance protein B